MKRKSFLVFLFVGIFIISCLVPLIGMIVSPETEAVGNERLSAAPSLKTENGTFNPAFLKNISDYIGDCFFLRHELINANSFILNKCFGVSGNDDVTLGRDGWLFYTETMDDVMGANIMSDRSLWCSAHALSLMQEYCEMNGASFIFTIAPNKASLYPENLPSRIPVSEHKNSDAFIEALKEQNIPYADLYRAFLAQGDVLYYRTDSHWNDRGAALAADTVLSSLNCEYNPFLPCSYTMSDRHKGDLYEMVYPCGTLEEENAVFDRAFEFEYIGMFNSVEDITIHTVNPSSSGSLLLFRDSFGNSMHSYLADSFGKACISRAMPYNLSALEREAADTVVIELVERNIEWLYTRAPIMPAPERDIELSDISDIFSVQAEVKTCDEMNGFNAITGNMSLAPDLSSPVYFGIGDKVFEASPVGDGQNPFTIYIPSEYSSDTCTVAVYIDGRLCTTVVNLTIDK